MSSTNLIQLFQLFKKSSYNTDSNHLILFQECKKIIMDSIKCDIEYTQHNNYDSFLIDRYGNYRLDIEYLKEQITPLTEYHFKELKNILKKDAIKYIDDLEEVSKYPDFEDSSLTPLENYITTLFYFIIEDIEYSQDRYFINLYSSNSDILQSYFLDSYYSPRTEIGIRRFEKERMELFGEEL
tara:strand:+ start:38 stop:586 length:549 start_codon:yes stop_codon:yes gene_type:complete